MSQLPCKDCASGHIHEGSPTGTVTTLHGLPTYVAEPPNGQEPKAVIVFLCDAFGWELPNSRLLADNYASKGGFRVLVPDMFDGHWLDHSHLSTLDTVMDKNASILWKIPAGLRATTGFIPFLFFNRLSVTGPRVLNFVRDVRASTSLPVGAAGFCWGGLWTTKLCSADAKASDGTPVSVDAGFTAHPSMLDVPKDIEAVSKPLSIANGTLDFQLTVPLLEKVKEIFKGKENTELVVYDEANHGFAVRGNPRNEREARQEKEAEEQALKFFTRHLTSSSKL